MKCPGQLDRIMFRHRTSNLGINIGAYGFKRLGVNTFADEFKLLFHAGFSTDVIGFQIGRGDGVNSSKRRIPVFM